jgi:hypothetical protein
MMLRVYMTVVLVAVGDSVNVSGVAPNQAATTAGQSPNRPAVHDRGWG